MIGSQQLWQHGMSELLLAGLLLALTRQTGASAAVAGLLAGLLVANRPPNIFFAVAAMLYILIYGRDRLLPFLLPAVTVAVLWLTYNLVCFENVSGGYGITNRAEKHDPFGPGIAGLLISAKGLLVFAPFFIFLLGSFGAKKRPDLARLFYLFVPAAALQLWLYGSFWNWPGGSCYGPRYLTDMTPVLILALVPAVERLRRPGR